ncbi:MAG: hypothetical protein LBC19_05865 [Tannerella sp.]|jgi:hypothetical protein|nr:hypothetical protein [Tannerella sp.]
MNKSVTLFIISILPLAAFGQTSYKQVYDKALELQIRSSVGFDGNGHWKFHPGWYYDLFHSKYESRENEDNNVIQLDSMNEAALQSLSKVIKARQDMEVIYGHELAHWNDRNNDWELEHIKTRLDDARESIGILTGEFPKHNVSAEDALKLYRELERIDDKVKTLSNAHLDNAKRRQGFENCLAEYNVLINVCYKINNYSLVASKYSLPDAVKNSK